MFFFPYQLSRKLTHTNLHLFKFSEFDSCLYPWNAYHSPRTERTLGTSPKDSCGPFSCALSLRQAITCCHYKFICVFYINRLNAVCMFLSSFTQHTDFSVGPCCICSFYQWVVFHYMDIPSVDGHMGCFQFLIILNKTDMHIHLHVSVWVNVFISPG